MIKAFFKAQIGQNLPYLPLSGQEKLINLLAEFLFEGRADSIFLLRGYAGTGKTSLVGALVKAWLGLQQRTILLAPTGRAAKVFAAYAGQTALTIHKKIYRQQSYSPDYEGFNISDNLHKNTLFIVDEASMIANESQHYGAGRLLDDLIEYVYAGEGCRLLLLGDTAQLPPVGQENSPALSEDMLAGYGLEVYAHLLDEVARQASDSGILYNATRLREVMQLEQRKLPLPQIALNGYADVIRLSGDMLVETISDSYDRVGMEESIVVTRSNKRANIFNQGIRGQILYREEELVSGDMILIAKNNYYWGEGYEEIDFIANGDVARVVRVRGEQQLYGLRFADVSLALPDYGIEIDAKVMLDTLHLESAALTAEQNNAFFMEVMKDYSDITTKRERMRRLKSDPYFNALQVKYAYAVTCHKAQGGQWRDVFVDMGYINPEWMGLEFYRWLYTAVTRATERLYLINIGDEFCE